MRQKWMVLLVIPFLTAPVFAQETPTLKNEKEKLSYALGMDLGNQLRKMAVDIDPALFGKGLNDALLGSKTLLTAEEARAAVAAFQAEMRQKQIEAARVAAENNKKAGDAFLAENKAKEGVVTLPSGLQYKILKAGNGKTPTDADTVECHYRGTLIDGTEFDSSYTRGQPSTFKLAGVIPGWREALKLMPVGTKWRLFVHPQLAYGERGAGRDIGPNATLIFEVELLAIK